MIFIQEFKRQLERHPDIADAFEVMVDEYYVEFYKFKNE